MLGETDAFSTNRDLVHETVQFRSLQHKQPSANQSSSLSEAINKLNEAARIQNALQQTSSKNQNTENQQPQTNQKLWSRFATLEIESISQRISQTQSDPNL